jgi:hypothetical protein
MFSRPLVRQVEARARQDAGFAQVLDELLLAPTTPEGTLAQVAAGSINERRRAVLTDRRNPGMEDYQFRYDTFGANPERMSRSTVHPAIRWRGGLR